MQYRSAVFSWLVLVGMLAASHVRAADLEYVSADWAAGDMRVPSYISLYAYVPDSVAANPSGNAPVLVCVPPGTTGAATSYFGKAIDGGIRKAADDNGFIMILPETSNGYWDAGSDTSLEHGSGGDSFAIVKAVSYTIDTYDANANRVYVVGTAAGGVMAEALLAVYPDLFKGGVIFGGAPAGCWADGYSTLTNYSTNCASGMTSHTAEEWGDLARAMYVTYTGAFPRVRLWHGSADASLNYKLLTESVKQWTNLHGLDSTPTATATNEQRWDDACGNTVLDAWTLPGSGASLGGINMFADQVIGFLALDESDDIDPVVAGCTGSGGTSNGGSGNAAGGGNGGSTQGGSSNGGSGDVTGDAGSGDTGNGGSGGAGTSGGNAGEDAGATGGTDTGASGGSSGSTPGSGGSGGAKGGTGPNGSGGSSSNSAGMAGAADPSLIVERAHACLCSVPATGSGSAFWGAALLAWLVAFTARRRRRQPHATRRVA